MVKPYYKTVFFWLVVIGIVLILAGISFYFLNIFENNLISIVIGGLGILVFLAGILIYLFKDRKEQTSFESNVEKFVNAKIDTVVPAIGGYASRGTIASARKMSEISFRSATALNNFLANAIEKTGTAYIKVLKIVLVAVLGSLVGGVGGVGTVATEVGSLVGSAVGPTAGSLVTSGLTSTLGSLGTGTISNFVGSSNIGVNAALNVGEQLGRKAISSGIDYGINTGTNQLNKYLDSKFAYKPY